MPPCPAAAVAALRVLMAVAAWALGEASEGGLSPRPPPLQATANPSDCRIEPYGPGGCDRARQPVFTVVSTQRSGTHFLAQQLIATGAVYHGPEMLYLQSHNHPNGINSTKSCCAAITGYLRENCRRANTVLPSAIAVGGVIMMSDIDRYRHEVFAALSKAGVKLLLLHRKNTLRRVVSELHHTQHSAFGAASEGALAKLRSLKASTSPDELFRKTRYGLRDQDKMITTAVVDYACYPRQLPMGRSCNADARGQSNETEVAACRERESKFAARKAVVASSDRYSRIRPEGPSVYLCALVYYEDLLEKIQMAEDQQCSAAGHRSAADPGCPLEAMVMFLSGVPAALGSFLQHRDAAGRNQTTTEQKMLKKLHVGTIWSFLDVDEEETRRKFRGSAVEWMLDD